MYLAVKKDLACYLLIWDKGKSPKTGHLNIAEIAILKLNRSMLVYLLQVPEEGAVVLFKIIFSINH